MKLAGRVALVTGSSRGIGRAIALRLASGGAHIVVNYKQNEEAAHATVAELTALGVRALPVQADMEKPEDIRALFAQIKAEFGGLDVLVVNAAASAFKPLMEAKEHNVRRTFAITVDAFLPLVQQAVALMEGRQSGRIVAVSGWDTLRVIDRHGILAGAKAAMETWVRYLACELAPKGINVNSVCPGPIVNTLYPHVYGGDAAGYEEWKRARIAATPKGRIGTPEDVAKVVAFLCSEDADWIVGQLIVCDGGLRLTHLRGG
ncbi:MAG: SDR family oxidoreductase [Chloroflexota bacterium]